jgi:hypothetical protein
MSEEGLSKVTARRSVRRLVPLALLALAACGGASVSVPPNLPVPVVNRIPLTMGIYLADDLRSYIHHEALETGDWRIEFGPVQDLMFNNLLQGMFDGVRPIQEPTAPGGEADGVLVPSIQEVQFSTPEQTRSDYFEVWVRYRFELYDRDGQVVGDWPLTAYGKANAGNYGMNSREPALQAAALAAMRDAMAFFTVQFRTIPVVQTWMNAELRGPQS